MDYNFHEFEKQMKTLPDNFSQNEDRVLEKKMTQHEPALKEKKSPLKEIEEETRSLIEKKLISEAEELLIELHGQGVSSAGTYCLLAGIHCRQNKFKKALFSYKKALEKNPEHLESLINLSLLRFDLGDYERGVLVYKKALNVREKKQNDQWQNYIAKRHIQSGEVYFKRGFWHEALLEFLKASGRGFSPLPLELKITECLWRLGRKKEALEKLLLIRKKNPISLRPGLLLAEYYFQMRNMTSAVMEWERILRFEPRNQEARLGLEKAQNIQSVRQGGPLA